MTRIKDLPTFETLDPTNWVAVDSNDDLEPSGKASPATLAAFVNSDLSPLLSVVEGTGITVSGDPQNPTISADQGGGDMYTDIYDPQNISNDAFARENHTGEQPISATTGLQDALDAPVDEPKLTRRLSARVGGMFDTVADLQADTTLTYSNVSPGDIIEAQGFRYEVADSGATDAHVETAGGVKLYAVPSAGFLAVEQFNAPTGRAIDAGEEWNRAADATRALGCSLRSDSQNEYLLNTAVDLFGIDGLDLQSRNWSSNSAIVPITFGLNAQGRAYQDFRIDHARWLPGLDIDAPTIRCLSLKNGRIFPGLWDYYEIYVTGDGQYNNELSGHAYCNYFGGQIWKQVIIDDPDSDGADSQWVNENTWWGVRFKENYIICNQYLHNHNKYYHPVVEGGDGVVSWDGRYNHQIGARFEGQVSVTFAEGSHSNSIGVTQKALASQSIQEFTPAELTLVDNGHNNHVYSDISPHTEQFCLYGIVPARSPSGQAGHQSSVISTGSWLHTIDSGNSDLFVSAPIKLERGTGWTFYSDEPLWRVTFEFYQEDGTLITSELPAGSLEGIALAWDATNNRYQPSSNLSNIRSVMYVGPTDGAGDPAYCIVRVRTGSGGLGGSTFKELALMMFSSKFGNRLAYASTVQA